MSPFRELDPPPGGLRRLQERLDGDREPAALRWMLVPAVATLALALWFGLSPAPEPTWLTASVEPALLRYGIGEVGQTGASLATETRASFALHEVPGAGDDVLFYWVGGR